MMKLSEAAKEAGVNVEIGLRMREKRKSRGISMRWVADKLGIAESYLCYLEKGQRNWNDELQNKFLKAIGEL